MGEVRFYAQTDPYAEFSNFAPFGIEMEGVWWPTVEHWFQAAKFADPVWRDRIRRAGRPKEAKALGRTRDLPIRADWDAVREDIMRQGVARKVGTHPGPRALLLSTGRARIIEDAPMDAFWGCGPDGEGRNRLGAILMDMRAALRRAGAR